MVPADVERRRSWEDWNEYKNGPRTGEAGGETREGDDLNMSFLWFGLLISICWCWSVLSWKRQDSEQ